MGRTASTRILSKGKDRRWIREGETPVSAKTGFERNLAIAKDIVQILAIVAAGTFAFFKFVIFDEPSLKKNISVSGELGWLKGAEYCLAELNIEVKNISKSNVEVQEIRGQAWLIDEPSAGQKGLSTTTFVMRFMGRIR